MEHKIETIPFELTIVGKGYRVKTDEAFQMIHSLWAYAEQDGFMQKLIDLSWEHPKCTLEGLLGVCGEEAKITGEQFTYFMGIRYDGEVPSDMQYMTIKHDTWVVISNVTEAWNQLYEWLPFSQYELADAPCIECYYAPDHRPENELWVPVIRK